MDICGICKKEFKDDKTYLEHKCEVTGYKPTQPEHQVESENIRLAGFANTIAKKEQSNAKTSK